MPFILHVGHNAQKYNVMTNFELNGYCRKGYILTNSVELSTAREAITCAATR
jgi:hypothetical protein